MTGVAVFLGHACEKVKLQVHIDSSAYFSKTSQLYPSSMKGIIFIEFCTSQNANK